MGPRARRRTHALAVVRGGLLAFSYQSTEALPASHIACEILSVG
jgi:hypothetical protein